MRFAGKADNFGNREEDGDFKCCDGRGVRDGYTERVVDNIVNKRGAKWIKK